MSYTNNIVLYQLNNIIIYKTLHEEDNVENYEKAEEILKSMKTKFTPENIIKIKKIDEQVYDFLVELIKTKKSKIINNYQRRKKVKLLYELMKIKGVGIKTSLKIITNYNLKHFSDLKPEMLSTETQRIGLKYFSSFNVPFNREVAEYYINTIKTEAKLVDSIIDVIPAGSYRRERNKLNDLDILIICEKKNKAQKAMVKLKTIITENYGIIKFIDGTFYIGFLMKNDIDGIPHHIDIKAFSEREKPSALLYFTGNRYFNINVRKRAIRMGFKLNEYGLYNKEGKRFKLRSEEEILAKLGLENIEPNKRTFTPDTSLLQYIKKN